MKNVKTSPNLVLPSFDEESEVLSQPEAEIEIRRRMRMAVSLFYFCQGLAFASWASRIPDIKTTLQLSDAQLGTLLFMLPLGQLITMPLSGRLVTIYGSNKVLQFAAPLYVVVLMGLGLVAQSWHLGFALLLFGVVGNMCNISVNTQGVLAENLYSKPIMSSFHGAWSIAGFTGALIALLIMNLSISPFVHFCIIAVLVWISILLNYKYLVPGKSLEQAKRKIFVKPEGALLKLGIIGFCCMATEGAMFDWSGVYFKEVVKAPNSLIVLGYATFMVMMATGRFIGDWAIRRLGRRTILQISGIFIFLGMGIAVIFPNLVAATFGFMLVGLGVACVIPTLYSVSGQNEKVPPGIALAMVSSVSYLGFLMGPPLIGYIAELANLRYSYAICGMIGLMVSVLVTRTNIIKN